MKNFLKHFSDGATDAGPAINAAIAQSSGKVKLPAGTYRIDTPVNCTGRSGLVVEGNGCHTKLVGRCAGKPIVDLTGSLFVTLRDMWIEGDATKVPSCGILAGRVADNVSSGEHNFDSLHVTGFLGVADYVGISSEGNTHHGNFSYENFQPGASCAALCTNNLWPAAIASPYAALVNNPAGGNTIHNFIGGAMGMDSPSSDRSASTLILEGVRGLTMQGTFLYGPGSKGIWIRGTGASFSNLVGAGEDELTTDFGVYIEAGSVCEGLNIDGFLSGGPLYAADGTTVINSRFRGRWAAGGLNLPCNVDFATIKNSHVDAFGLNVRVRAEAKGVDFGNGVQTIALPPNTAGCHYQLVNADGSYTFVTH